LLVLVSMVRADVLGDPASPVYDTNTTLVLDEVIEAVVETPEDEPIMESPDQKPQQGFEAEEEILPSVFIVLLIRNKAHTLPYFLNLLEKLDYPKHRIALW